MPSPGYRLANYERYPFHGFWGPVTANIDWCEGNYEVTYYVAEFWNTVTTLLMVTPPIIQAFRSFKNSNYEYTYLVPFLALIVVGVGSGLFHMTLLYEMQLMDELPMIWGTATMLYALYEVDKVNRGFNRPLATVLLAACSTCTIAYLLLDDRLIFEGTYTLMVLWSIFLGIQAIWNDHSLRGFFLLAFVMYLSGFMLWCADRMYCDELRYVRRRLVPSYLAPFFQFHAWWHAFASFGTYVFILMSLRARMNILIQPCKLRFGLGIFPYYDSEAPLAKLA